MSGFEGRLADRLELTVRRNDGQKVRCRWRAMMLLIWLCKDRLRDYGGEADFVLIGDTVPLLAALHFDFEDARIALREGIGAGVLDGNIGPETFDLGVEVFDRPAARKDLPAERATVRVSRIMAALIARFGATCHYCGRAGTESRDPDGYSWTRDHVRPRIEGGTNDPANIVLACVCCNSTKRDRPVGYLLERLGQTAPAGTLAAVQHRTAVEEAEDLVAALFE